MRIEHAQFFFVCENKVYRLIYFLGKFLNEIDYPS